MSDESAVKQDEQRLSEKELCPDDLLKGQEEAFARDIERLKLRKPDFVTVQCPACGSGDFSPVFEKYTLRYVTCSSCGTIYMNPRPTSEIMAGYYSDSENYQYWANYIFPASETARREKIHKPWLERVLGYCDRFSVNRGTLLEIGAGFGTFSSVAMESGAFDRILAVEPTPEMAEACRRRGLTVIEKRIEDVGEDIASVDVTVSFEVIEHLFNPNEFLSGLHRIVKPGGLLVLSCPNGQGFDISMLGSVSLAIDPEHVNLFNPSSLRHLVELHGFHVADVSTPGRLDVEFVHLAIKEGEFDIPSDPFLRKVLWDDWESLGPPFQQFLSENGLSSHMWLAAIKRK